MMMDELMIIVLRFLPVTPDTSGPGAYDPPLPPEMRQISISAPNGISPIVEVGLIEPNG